MAIFGDALRKGIEAHSRAAAARREIDAVLAQASREVSAVLGVDVVLEIDTGGTGGLLVSDSTIASPFGAVGSNTSRSTTRLVARSPSGPAWMARVLAEIELSEVGYPVQLRWNNQVTYAEDRGSFESALAAVLESASAGEKLAALGRPSPPGEGGTKVPSAA